MPAPRVTAPTPPAPGTRPGAWDADLAAFQEARPRLMRIARRVLRAEDDAEDVVQDAWIRWQRADRGGIRGAAPFLAATTARLAINVTASAHARRETTLHPGRPEPADAAPGPAARAERRDVVERGLRMLLERLTPAERAAYLLREAFGDPYRRIAQALCLTETHTRQLVRRARVRLAGPPRREVHDAEVVRLRDVFLFAARTGDLADLERRLVADIGRDHDRGRQARAA